MKVNYAFPSNVVISDEAKDFIRKTLVLDPSKRLSLDEMIDHPLIRNNPNKPNVGSESLRELKPTAADSTTLAPNQASNKNLN
eukprot:CAMPEP_0114580898 /NCGR_PEP_ID=MMETSP0125-20121206/5070_1 /TAXON_ID=485358 ORGANISM="Aristerostoma sp., Strain ATCC 50986" /NCGR_SAMPLE_ID=MMETSP0125 /ASSEMBLY_ACC=CAM_ASM_000245 /LENGTH=82 /DNA_ID=CAMNT_0001772693 /DNA_START=708 /DNA_END=956 /DNA_ORIENTATION=+